MLKSRFVRGNLVEIKSASEIAATLDASGCFEGIPFMPEMAALCGQRFRVHRRADRTCVEGVGMARLDGTVFLDEVRCDGSAHDGCQRGCLMFWKEAWLKPVAASEPATAAHPDPTQTSSKLAASLPIRDGARYICQSTALAAATVPIGRWAPSMMLQEVRDGELPLSFLLAIVGRSFVNKIRVTLGYPAIGALKGPARGGPKGDLKLKSGDRVRVLREPEISATLDPEGRNRGLTFEPDMADFAGKTFEVDRRIERIIHEETGHMRTLTSTVVLKNVNCAGLCSKNCPRNNPVYWRESWLARADASPRPTPSTGTEASSVSSSTPTRTFDPAA